MTIPTTDPESEARTNPVDTADVLDSARHAELMAMSVTTAARELPDESPLFATVDLMAAAAHFRQAARLIDQAAARINDQAVTR